MGGRQTGTQSPITQTAPSFFLNVGTKCAPQLGSHLSSLVADLRDTGAATRLALMDFLIETNAPCSYCIRRQVSAPEKLQKGPVTFAEPFKAITFFFVLGRSVTKSTAYKSILHFVTLFKLAYF